MSKEQLNAFLEKVQGDTSLQEKLNAPTTPEAVIEIAKDAGFSITAEDIQSMQSQSGEVSDDELEGATGGLVEVTLASPTTPTTSPTVITRVTHNGLRRGRPALPRLHRSLNKPAFNTWHHRPHLAGFFIRSQTPLPTYQAVAPHLPMSEEQLTAFLEKVKSDTELQEKLKAAASPEAGLEIAKAAGFSITSEDIQSKRPSNSNREKCPTRSWKVHLGGQAFQFLAGGIMVAGTLLTIHVTNCD